MIEAAPLPLTCVVGPQMAAVCAALHTRTDPVLRSTVTAQTGTDRVEQVHLSDGTMLDADLVVVGSARNPSWCRSPIPA